MNICCIFMSADERLVFMVLFDNYACLIKLCLRLASLPQCRDLRRRGLGGFQKCEVYLKRAQGIEKEHIAGLLCAMYVS